MYPCKQFLSASFKNPVQKLQEPVNGIVVQHLV